MNQLKNYKRVLLVNPAFPKKNSKKHKYILPIGLVKIGTYYQKLGTDVKLIWLNDEINENELIKFDPEIIYITSVFTYYASYVKDAVTYCKSIFPNVKVIVGGVFASIMPSVCKEYTGCDEVIVGILDETENCKLNYELLENHKDDFDYQIIHTTRGCNRNCKYCCGHLFEKYSYKKSITDEVTHKEILFYDNNLLSNPYIKNILEELIHLKNTKKISHCECRVGIDYRIINKKPYLSNLLKQAGFRNIKIAWDGDLELYEDIKNCVKILNNSGFRRVDIGVYMLSNYELPYNILEQKRIKCYEMGVTIINCRYIPLNSLYDGYNPYKKEQTENEYYIHKNWSDLEVRTFARNVRKTNQTVKFQRTYYTKFFEKKKVSKEEYAKFKKMSFDEAKNIFKDAWNPLEYQRIIQKDYQIKLI